MINGQALISGLNYAAVATIAMAIIAFIVLKISDANQKKHHKTSRKH